MWLESFTEDGIGELRDRFYVYVLRNLPELKFVRKWTRSTHYPKIVKLIKDSVENHTKDDLFKSAINPELSVHTVERFMEKKKNTSNGVLDVISICLGFDNFSQFLNRDATDEFYTTHFEPIIRATCHDILHAYRQLPNIGYGSTSISATVRFDLFLGYKTIAAKQMLVDGYSSKHRERDLKQSSFEILEFSVLLEEDEGMFVQTKERWQLYWMKRDEDVEWLDDIVGNMNYLLKFNTKLDHCIVTGIAQESPKVHPHLCI